MCENTAFKWTLLLVIMLILPKWNQNQSMLIKQFQIQSDLPKTNIAYNVLLELKIFNPVNSLTIVKRLWNLENTSLWQWNDNSDKWQSYVCTSMAKYFSWATSVISVKIAKSWFMHEFFFISTFDVKYLIVLEPGMCNHLMHIQSYDCCIE